MTFIHPYLLLGLSLVALPVVLHLLMRRKPSRLEFPAFRFLRQKAFINRRKLRLQHLLLLLLRMLLIAFLCLGLARPRIVTQQINLGSEKAVAAVFVFDTSMSMEYSVAGATRFEEAKQRARELLDEMSDDSDLLLLDSGDEARGSSAGGEWIRPATARNRIESLQLRPANGPLNRQVERAFGLLHAAGEMEDAKPRFLFLFSDRTRESWDSAAGKRLHKPDDVTVIFVDVGVDNPADLALDRIEIEPPVVAPGSTFQIKVYVRATGAAYDTTLTCQLKNEGDSLPATEERAVALGKGQAKPVVVERPAPALPEGVTELPLQVTVKLATNDALPFNNTRFATLLLREPRKVLTIADDGKEARPWKLAIQQNNAFRCDVLTVADAEKLDARAWKNYKVACLFETARPTIGLWNRLQSFVETGGGLCLVPAGRQMEPVHKEYNDEAGRRGLLPARWQKLIVLPPGKTGLAWSNFSAQHPLTAALRQMIQTENPDFAEPSVWPRANGFWTVKPVDEQSAVVIKFAEEEGRPILVERPFGQGRVLQLTTPLDGMEMSKNRPWHNYWNESSFGFILVDLICKYLAGETTVAELNYSAGVPPLVAPPSPPQRPPYSVQGPNLTAAEMNLAFTEGGGKLAVPQAITPGNYLVKDGKGLSVAGFSVNVRPEESQLERIPIEELEAVLGKGAILPVGRKDLLKNAFQGRWSPPVELMPWLMMVLLVALVIESLLANKFYRKLKSDDAPDV